MEIGEKIMIDRLKYLLDHYKDNPKMLKILSPLTAMSEKDQENSLQIIELVLKGMNK
jgi:hypothetical protein